MLPILAAVLMSGCTVTDGDTMRCNGERIRLLGIDAPDYHCPPHRICAPGDPQASEDNLRRLVDGNVIYIDRVGKDRYGRTLAIVYAGGLDASCAQLRGGFAVYRRDWDNGLRVGRTCSAALKPRPTTPR